MVSGEAVEAGPGSVAQVAAGGCDQLGHADLSTTHTYLSSFSAADRIAHLQHLED